MAGPGFVHLHTHSEFSLLDGAARLDKLVYKAAELEMGSLALTDHGVMYGAIDFYSKCKASKIKPIVGVEAYVANGDHREKTARSEKNAYHLLMLAKNLEGYKNLLKLTTIAAIDGFYYKPRIDHELIEKYHEGIVATSACLGGEVCSALMKGDYKKARDIAGWYRDVFGRDDYYIEIQNHTLPEQIACNPELIKIAKELGLKVICTNDVHYLGQKDASAHDVLLCIGTNTQVSDTKRLRYASEEFYMKSGSDMLNIFKENPEALDNTLEISEKCNLDLDSLFGRAPLPHPGLPEGHTPQTYLREIAFEGVERKLGSMSDKYRDRLEYELRIVEETGFAQYFLIVRDFALFAREKGIFFGVRGSAAGSLTSFGADITDIDPVDYELTFERFLNPERIQMPDIDMDFEDSRRSEVIEYVTHKYGRDHVAQITTFGTLAARAALKDTGRALGMPIPDVNRVIAMIPTLPLHVTIEQALNSNPEFKQMYNNEPGVKTLVDTATRLEGLSRHASVHAAGVVISHEPLVDYTPLQKAADGGYVTQYNANNLEKIGLLKMDFLGLINLTILSRALENIKKSTGEVLDVWKLPMDDQKAFDILGAGATTGIFQLESSGMRRYVQELKPTSVRDLAAMVALYRPGPMAHIPQFIRSKHGKQKIQYMHPLLEEVLSETYGVIVYQDQVMRIAQVIAGYTLGQADLLRRAMGKKKKEEMEAQRENFLKGAEEKGIEKKIADAIFNLMEPFAGYAFNKAHAVCYANVAYQTAYLKANYPIEYMAALLACYMEKADKIASCLEECARMNISVLAPDVNKSFADFVPEGNGIRFGLAGIKNVGRAAVEVILEARKATPFTSLTDFCNRTAAAGGVTRATVEALIQCGAFQEVYSGPTKPNRRMLVEAIDTAMQSATRILKDKESGQGDLFGLDDFGPEESVYEERLTPMPEYSGDDILRIERDLLGLYFSDHPLSKYRQIIENNAKDRVDDLNERTDKEIVQIGGLITTVRQLRSKSKNELMAFMTLEDLSGKSVAVSVFPQTFREFGQHAVKDKVVILRGRISRRVRGGDDEEEQKNTEIIADEIRLLGGLVAEASATEVHMRIEPPHRDVLHLVRAVIEQHMGDSKVYLYVANTEGTTQLVCNLTVDPNDQLRNQLERILGKGSIWLE